MLICPVDGNRTFADFPPQIDRKKWPYYAGVGAIAVALLFWFLWPQPDQCWSNLASDRQLLDEQRFDDAAARLTALTARCPDLKEAYVTLGNALVGATRYNDAINAYGKAIQIDANFASAYLGRGWVRWFTQDLDGAVDDYRNLVRIEPGNLQGYLELERVLYELDRPDDVAAAWETAAQANPDWQIAPGRRLIALARGEHWAQMRAELPALLSSDAYASLPYYHYLYGRALDEAKQYSAAIPQLSKAISLSKARLQSAEEFDNTAIDTADKSGEELLYAYIWANRPDDAKRWQEDFKRLPFILAELALERGRERGGDGHYDDAVAYLTNAFRLYASYKTTYVDRMTQIQREVADLYERDDRPKERAHWQEESQTVIDRLRNGGD